MAMSRSRRLGLDELMIVNPGLRNGAAYLLGDDNTHASRADRGDDLRDALHLGIGEFRVYRETEAFARGFLRHGKITLFVTQARVALLQV